jgi:3-oxoacyl-[acyl-carrier-protein] synthase II
MSDPTPARGRRVVITGMGAITPVGLTVEAFWESLKAGRHGFARIETFDTTPYKAHIAGVARGFDPLDYIDRKEARRMDRFCQLAVAAAKDAMADSGLDVAAVGRFRVGTIIGTGVGGLETLHDEYEKLYKLGNASRTSPLFIPMFIPNMAAGMVSMAYGAMGANFSVASACATSAHAIGEAFRNIKYGHLDACITGGSEAPITPIALGGFANMTALSQNPDPDTICRPFDKERDGFVMSEGAGILILEALETALARGARIYAEIVGYGATADAYHITSPDPEGEGTAMSMRLAMQEAGVEPAQVGYINAHGTSTPLNDKYETNSIKRAMGDHARTVAVSSTKSMTGHLLGAAGAVEAMACALAMRDGLIPPTINYHTPDPECDLDYVPNAARKTDATVALSNSLGFGGHNATLCIRKYEG